MDEKRSSSKVKIISQVLSQYGTPSGYDNFVHLLLLHKKKLQEQAQMAQQIQPT